MTNFGGSHFVCELCVVMSTYSSVLLDIADVTKLEGEILHKDVVSHLLLQSYMML